MDFFVELFNYSLPIVGVGRGRCPLEGEENDVGSTLDGEAGTPDCDAVSALLTPGLPLPVQTWAENLSLSLWAGLLPPGSGGAVFGGS